MFSTEWRRKGAALLGIVLSSVIAGCGSSAGGSKSGSASDGPTTSPTATQTTSTAPEEHAPSVEKVEITSPVVSNEGPLPRRYGCGGSNISPVLRWQGIPAGTAELMLFVLKLRPVNGALYYDWALAGLNPSSHGLEAGKVPPDAVVGKNSLGTTRYSVCPLQRGADENYLAVLFALPRKLQAKPGFDASKLRQEALQTADYQGYLFFHYKR